MKFTRKKPTTKGRYTWRLPESEKRGTYDIRVVLSKAIGGGLQIITEEGDAICTIKDSLGGTWAKGWSNPAISHAEEKTMPKNKETLPALRCGGVVRLLRATSEKSCDNCDAQEGRHYCLLHSTQIKNMDLKRCHDWSKKQSNKPDSATP